MRYLIIILLLCSCESLQKDHTENFILSKTEAKPETLTTVISEMMDDGLTPQKIRMSKDHIEITLEHGSGTEQVIASDYYLEEGKIMVKTLNNQGYIEYANRIGSDTIILQNGHERFILIRSELK